MKINYAVLGAAAALASAANAVDLSFASDDFAEKYAFSTNRSELISSLKPETREWFTYSILDAQTEGRLDEAAALIKKWDDLSGHHDDFRIRQTFLCWKDDAPRLSDLRRDLGNCGIVVKGGERETALAPNTYPSRLDQGDVSFESFLARGRLNDKFKFLQVTREGPLADLKWEFNPSEGGMLPDTPGLLEAAIDYLKSSRKSNVFTDGAVFRSFTLEQLFRMERALENTSKDLRNNAEYARVVLAKLALGADDDADDYATLVAIAKKRIEFVETLGDALAKNKIDEYREYLKLRASHGDRLPAEPEFDRYLQLALANLRRRGYSSSRIPSDDVVSDYIAAYRRAGVQVSKYADRIEAENFSRIVAEADLLSGKSASEVNVNAFRPGEFEELQKRVELKWSDSNPKVFSANDDVKLAVDVKNVPKMRISVFALDPFGACEVLGGEVKSDIDLDAAVPTVTRSVDFSSYAPVVRHTETLILPELKEPGVYVVELTGAGISSRALVRKGRLRVFERHDAGGHVFTAFDEKGAVVKGTKLRLGETVFKSDENGEIGVPFATDEKGAGMRTAFVTDGRLASSIEFEHLQEKVEFSAVFLIQEESFVAGREATLIVKPQLKIAGKEAPVELLQDVTLTAEFCDLDKNENSKSVPGFKLSDDSDGVYKFRVPNRLASVQFELSGKIKLASTGKEEHVSAWRLLCLNNKPSSPVQAFLRRSSGGYRIELRGLTGEPLAYRAVTARFAHRAFWRQIEKRLQTDENGVIELGELADVSRVALSIPDAYAEGGALDGFTWDLSDSVDSIPHSLTAAEGEDFELPLRDLFSGEWPGAKKMNCRVSLLEQNADGETIRDCIANCSYSNGVLRIAGLKAGDYVLTLRDRATVTGLKVAKTAGAAIAGGVIPGVARPLVDTGRPALMRVDSASLSKEGVLTVRLANHTPETRVHVFATRTCNLGWGTPYRAFAVVTPETDGAGAGRWGSKTSDYVSGRDLGEKLRYVMDRRDQPGRVGNMLFKPSLILNPWSTVETGTKDVELGDGAAWDRAVAPMSARSAKRSGAAYGVQQVDSGATQGSLDFLPEAASVVANLRPDANGVVSFDLSKASEAGLNAQDFTILAVDASGLDQVELLGAIRPFAPRDLRHRNAASVMESTRTKAYSTVGELFGLMESLPGGGGDELREFKFLKTWNKLTDAEKRELYGKHACHETDFFLYMKDRAFFDAVVAPHLRNKRFKRFVDKWLLGEDLSEWAKPGALQNLNAFEQVLLAARVKSMASVVARSFKDACDAAPVDPDLETRALNTVLDVMNDESASSSMKDVLMERMETVAPAASAVDMGVSMDEEYAAVEAEPLDTIVLAASAVEKKSVLASRSPAANSAAARRSALKRRSNRQLYRPPERTREWVETHYWRRRQSENPAGLVSVNQFWRDVAEAVAAHEGGDMPSVRTTSVMYVDDNFTAKMLAVALTDLPFAEKEGDEGLVFSRRAVARTEAASPVVVSQRFRDPKAARADGSEGAEVADEFVKGRVYELVTVLSNPTEDNMRLVLTSQIPEGAIALGGERASENRSVEVGRYDMVRLWTSFYFPLPGKGVGAVVPASVVDGDGRSATAGAFACNVVAESTKKDTTSWAYISQNGTKGEVLAYLRNKNLYKSVELERIAWRMKDGAFAKEVMSVLDSRGVYCEELALSGLLWRDAYDPKRFREVLSRKENLKKIAAHAGPALVSPLVTIDPEEADLFEHKEYWPIINSKVHAVGGKTVIANEGLKTEYRAFLDTLAAKRTLSLRDRLLAAVYLVAQDRIPEAKEQVENVKCKMENGKSSVGDGKSGTEREVETVMQLDYLKAYLAFCDGEVERGREIAAKYADYAVPLWRDRFREVVAQADEALGRTPSVAVAKDEAALAPTISLAADSDGGSVESVVVAARNLESCVVKAYPTDIEIAFTKNPFGSAAQGADTVRALKPAWSQAVSLQDGETRVKLPSAIRSKNLVLVAEGAEGRAQARLELAPKTLDVQVSREYRQIRVKDAKGRPLRGVYVKVYARDGSGSEVEFHKDGYTDLRGAFDYASVSTDSAFRPSEYSILILHDKEGSRIVKVKQ